MKLDPRQQATIYAALRCYQAVELGGFRYQSADLEDLATNAGKYEPLSAGDIDVLCEQMGTAEEVWL